MHVWRQHRGQWTRVSLSLLFFSLFHSTSTFSSPSEVRQNNICEDALEWNILVTHLVWLGHYSKTHTSSFTQSHTHIYTHACSYSYMVFTYTVKDGWDPQLGVPAACCCPATMPPLHVGQPLWATPSLPQLSPSAPSCPSLMAYFFLYFCSFLILTLRTCCPVFSKRDHSLLLLSLMRWRERLCFGLKCAPQNNNPTY